MENMAIAIVTGLVSSVATITALSIEIKWIKLSMKELYRRVSKLEEKV